MEQNERYDLAFSLMLIKEDCFLGDGPENEQRRWVLDRAIHTICPKFDELYEKDMEQTAEWLDEYESLEAQGIDPLTGKPFDNLVPFPPKGDSE